MASTTIKACVLHGPKNFEVEERQLHPPGPDEVQVSIHSTGICGSDLHYYHHFANGDIKIREPLSLGHESAGTVSAVGSLVSGLAVGDNVALEVGMPCERCARCTEGRYNLCKDVRFRGSAKLFPHVQGTLQQVINHPAKWCYKLPTNVSMEQGALLEPMSVAIHAVRRAGAVDGCKVLVLGAGAVGLLTAAVLVASGARVVVVADIEEKRVDFAVREGYADKGVTLPRKRAQGIEERLEIAQDNAKLLVAALGTKGQESGEFDAVFECTGVEACVQTAIYASRAGGKVLLVGMGTAIQTLPMSAAALREVDLLGVFRYAATYDLGIRMLTGTHDVGDHAGRKLPDISKLATHRFEGFENVPKAFEVAAKGSDGEGKMAIKVIINL